MRKYQKPKVLRRGYFPEPVESGCCLTSCGGSPGGLQSGEHAGKAFASALIRLETTLNLKKKGASCVIKLP